jgi:hypothetical protein
MNSSRPTTDEAGDTRLRDTVALVAVFAAIYLPTTAGTILGHDAAEFATIYADGGYAHPPGYPLYSMYLRAMSWLPVSPPAAGASLATALVGIAAVVVLYHAIRSWGAGSFAALFGALAFGLSTDVWVYQTQPEVFALNHLAAATILWLAGPGPPLAGRRRVVALGVVAGLALANHHTIALMAPIGLWGVYRGVREADGSPLTTLGFGAAALATGLAPYAYLPIVHAWELGWHWGAPTDFQGVLHIFLRQDYGTFRMTTGEEPIGAAIQLGFFARAVPLDMLVVPAIASLVGVWVASRGLEVEGDPRAARMRTACLLGSFVLLGPVFLTQLTREPDGINHMLVRRFHLLPQLHLAFLAGLGASYLRQWLPSRATRGAVLGALVVGGLATGLPAIDQHHAPIVEQYVQDTFGSVPEEAVVIGTGDHNAFGSLYYQRALDRRTDVLYLSASMLAHRWYHRRRIREHDIPFEYRGSEVGTDRLFGALFDTGRPVFVTRPFHDELLDGWRAVPHGTLIRVFPPDAMPPPPHRAFDKNVELYADFTISPRAGAWPTTWSRVVLEDYARTWRTLASSLESTGHPRLAGRARQLARQFAPWNQHKPPADRPSDAGG